MQIIIKQHTEIIAERTALMLEAEALLAKIARLTTRYQSKIYQIRKKIQAMEKHL